MVAHDEESSAITAMRPERAIARRRIRLLPIAPGRLDAASLAEGAVMTEACRLARRGRSLVGGGDADADTRVLLRLLESVDLSRLHADRGRLPARRRRARVEADPRRR